jgi:hypothetical protein
VRRLALAAAAVLGLAASAPALAARSVLHVGDSLAVGSDPPLRALLPGWSFTTDALKSRPSSAGVAIIDGRPSLPAALVVELGTNDSPDATAAFAARVRHVVALAGPKRCVVWVNIHRPPYNGISYAGFNRVLAQQAAAAPNLAVVDWNGLVSSGQAQVAGDGVHATPEGYRVRAQAIAQALSGCSSSASAAPNVGGSHTLGAAKARRHRRTPAAKAKPRPTPAPKPKAIKVYVPKPGTSAAVVPKPAAAKSSGAGPSTWTYLGIAVALVLLAAAAARFGRGLVRRKA